MSKERQDIKTKQEKNGNTEERNQNYQDMNLAYCIEHSVLFRNLEWVED